MDQEAAKTECGRIKIQEGRMVVEPRLVVAGAEM